MQDGYGATKALLGVCTGKLSDFLDMAPTESLVWTTYELWSKLLRGGFRGESIGEYDRGYSVGY